jgi:hypothetical protein
MKSKKLSLAEVRQEEHRQILVWKSLKGIDGFEVTGLE